VVADVLLWCIDSPEMPFLQLRAGYSQLAFNRPGFGCSTGTPWPQIDANAVVSVIDFAIKVCAGQARVVLGCLICSHGADAVPF
jgi:hypothetical protein